MKVVTGVSLVAIPAEQGEAAYNQEASDWKHITFLPFQASWELCLMISIFVNSLLSIYDLYFSSNYDFTIDLIYYLCEIMYLIDNVLAIMHRNMTKTRKKRSYPPRNLGIILIDFLTLHPLYEIKYFLSLTNYRTEEDLDKNQCKWKCVVRTYRMFLYEMKRMNEVGLNQMTILCLQRLAKITIIGQIFAAIIFKLAQTKEANWAEHLDEFAFDVNSSIHWWGTSFFMMTEVVVNNFSAFLKPENVPELLTFTSAMLLGFIIGFVLFMGRLVVIFMRIDRNYFGYAFHVSKIMSLLDEWEADVDLKSKTFEYYTTFYRQRHGMRDMPDLFKMLPPSLQKEVTVDIYWEALRHTHLFNLTDMSFKRSVSLVMKSEFLLPAEFLFRVGELKAKMIYVVSGVIQALSKEDDDSPLISFSSGTVLGETACLVPCQSVSNLRAVTYCEIQVLYLTDLYKVLLNYPLVTRRVRECFKERISVATRGVQTRKTYQNIEYTDNSIRNVKRRWNEIWMYAKKPEALPSQSSGDIEDGSKCVTANLNLLVLSNDVELRVESICLSPKCPFIMDPDTEFRKCLDYMVIFAIIVQSVIVPKVACFEDEMGFHELSVCLLMDVIYIFDIYLQASTAVRHKNRLITDSKELIIGRLKNVQFIVDVVAIFPIDYIVWGMDIKINLGLCKLNRLLKIYKIFTMLKSLQYNIKFNTILIRALKWFIFYLVTIYWFTALIYFVAKINDDLASKDEDFWAYLILIVNYYLGYGASSTESSSVTEATLCFFLTVTGHLVYCVGISEQTGTSVLKYKSKQMDTIQWWAMKNELTRQRLDPGITKRLVRFLYFNHSVRGCQIVGENSIFKDAPVELRNEIVRHRIADCLKQVPLFQNTKKDTLRYICAHAQIKIIPPGATLMDVDVKSDIFYVIMRGFCRLRSFLPGDSERGATSVLQIGDTFPFLETLHDTFSFVKVECLTVVELLLIKTHIVTNALQTSHTDFSCFQQALNEHRRIYGTIMKRAGARLPPMVSKIKSKGKGNIFEYEIHDSDDIELTKFVFKQAYSNLGMWSFIRFFILKRTINPTNWPYITWEITRCTLLIIYILSINIRYSVLIVYFNETLVTTIYLIFDSVALIDLYIRLHCQYYNDKGILVTHPLYTAKNYFKTAFIMDLMGCFHVHAIGLDRLFGQQYLLWIQILVLTATRCCQLYRPFKGLSFLDNRLQGKKRNAINMFRYGLLVIICISLVCSLTMLVMCEHEGYRLVCDVEKSYDFTRGLYQYVYYMYTVTISVTGSSTGAILENVRHAVLTVVMLVPLTALRWLFFVSLTSRGVGGNVELTIYRDRMKNYMIFLKDALISDEDKQLIVLHYEYIWKKTHGLNAHEVIKNFHPQLEQDLARAIYHNCLKRVQIFYGGHFSVFQAVSHRLQQEFFTKDSNIIRCNDVNSKLFFVQDGKVDIYTAGVLMCSLRTGGVFGCLSKTGVTRQTINAVASIHSLVLTVDGKLFYKTIEAFDKILERFQRATMVNIEYMQELADAQIHQADGEFQRTKLHDFFKKILIFENNNVYLFFNYLINVHIYPLSSIMILTLTFVHLNEIQPKYITSVLYLTDVIHFVKMGVKFHLIYVDPESGMVISDPYSIRKKYLRSGFWFDFFTLLPFELLANCYTSNNAIYNLACLNRTCRFLHLVLYYYQCEERLLMKDHLKWTYMFYSLMFQLHLFLCLWLIIACPNTRCWYRYKSDTNNLTQLEFVSSNDTLESTIMAYMYVVNIYTATSLKGIMPLGISEVTITLLMMIVTQVLVMNLVSNYVSHLLVNKHNFINYEVKFQSLGTYLQKLELSPFLFAKVKRYCLRLWNRERGSWLPFLITESPPCLKENVLQILYGRHLNNHVLFNHTHVDFLRQLVVYLDRFVFSTGDCIVEKGDADCCMYFINSGEIIQLDTYAKVEYYVGTLTAGTSFGEAQGLQCIPHKFSYRSKADSEVLILNKSKWSHLLKWFPASREQILSKGKEVGLLEDDAVI